MGRFLSFTVKLTLNVQKSQLGMGIYSPDHVVPYIYIHTYIHVGSLKVLWDNACIKHGGWMGQYCFVQIFLGGDITTDITNVMIHPELGWFRFMKFILTSTNPLSIYIYILYTFIHMRCRQKLLFAAIIIGNFVSPLSFCRGLAI